MNRKKKNSRGRAHRRPAAYLEHPSFRYLRGRGGRRGANLDKRQGQIKTVVNNVVFPVLDVILAVLFFVKVGSSYFEYRKHAQSNSPAQPSCLPVCCSLWTAPLYIWGVVGM